MGKIGFGWLTWSPMASICEHSNEPSDSMKKADYCFTCWI